VTELRLGTQTVVSLPSTDPGIGCDLDVILPLLEKRCSELMVNLKLMSERLSRVERF